MQENKISPQEYLQILDRQTQLDKNISEEVKQRNDNIYKIETQRQELLKDNQDKNRKLLFYVLLGIFIFILIVMAFSFWLISTKDKDTGMFILTHFGTALLAFIGGFGLAKNIF